MPTGDYMVKGSQIAPFGLRMQPELKEWVQKRAEENRRSLNSEIVIRLEESKAREEKRQADHE